MGPLEKHFQREASGGLTGELFESECIGVIDTRNPEYQKALSEAINNEAGDGMKVGYIRFRTAMDLAKRFQPYDPTNPTKPFARDLRISVADLLIQKKWILDNEGDQDRIRFYTASGTPLDKFHRADAFIEFEHRNGQKYHVTLDLTLNPNKQQYGYNVIVHQLPDPTIPEEEKDYLAAVEKYAEEIVQRLEAQIQEERLKT